MYAARLTPPATIAVGLDGTDDRAGDTYVAYSATAALPPTAIFHGEIKGAVNGEVLQLYA